MRFALALAGVLVGPLALAQTTTKMNISYAGAPAGETTYTVNPDGSFSAKATLDLKVAKIVSTLSGKRGPDGTLTSLEADQDGPAGQKVQFGLKGGKWWGRRGGVEKELPPPSTTTITFGNYNPQFTTPLLKAVKLEVGVPQKFSTLLIDAGAETPITVTYKGEKTFPIGTVRRYTVDLGRVMAEVAMTPDGLVVGEEVVTQKLKFVSPGWEALFVDPLAAYPELSQPTFGVVRESGLTMNTRDGQTLKVDLVRPDGPGKFPTILKRTPYGRLGELGDAEMWAKRGYVVVAQDCRGRGDSGGEWDPFVHEELDGYDTIEWITHQPWSDQKVGMIGGSYVGYVQWAAAVQHHPALKCIVPQVSPPDAMSNLPYDHGMFYLLGNLWWSRIVDGKNADMSKAGSMVGNTQALTTLPLSQVDDKVIGHNVPFFDKWLERDGLAKWKGFDFTQRLSTVTIPALHISGWWDGDGIGTKINWAKLRAAGRKNQWLIYGPWTHAFNTTTKLGDVNYGPDAIIELDSLYLRWFDTWLKGKDVGLNKIPRVKVFVTGRNQWVSLSDWPSPESTTKTLFLASNGRLVDKPIAKDIPTSYTYDPSKDVVPAALEKSEVGGGSTDVTELEKDKSSFLYTSAVLKAPLTLTGPIEVALSFRSSAKDTDFVVSLCDKDRTGKIRVVGQSGKLRASYLGGLDRPRPLIPGKVYLAKISPWDTAHELKAGHRLVVLIRCSGFPAFARNLGTAEPIKTATRMVTQRNQILHDSLNVSSVRFHVLK